ncbi:MAG: hypothetical protein JWL61_4048 [Gemmatimonadetes bacterium]|nr:hypothetical protein [Gemmatimonadota bacterium]
MSADLGTAPSHGDNHPIALCLHALIDLARVLHTDPELVTDLDLGAGQDFLAEATRQLSMAKELLDRQERTIEEQRAENVKLAFAAQAVRVENVALSLTAEREHTYATRVEEANSALNEALIDRNNRIAAASKRMEQLLITASIDTQRSGVFFTEVRRTREDLDPTIALAPTRTTGPRLAAGSR